MSEPAPLSDNDYMRRALHQARLAFDMDEVPIGAVLVERLTGRILSETHNHTIARRDPTAHAEMLVIRAGCTVLDAQRIPDCDLYVTLEPCPMCAAAASYARVARVVYGAADPKSGGLSGDKATGPCLYQHPQLHHKPQLVSGVLAADSTALLQEFFQNKRRRLKEQKTIEATA